MFSDREMSLQQHTMFEAEGAEFGDIEFIINDINDDTKPRSQVSLVMKTIPCNIQRLFFSALKMKKKFN